MDLYIENLMLIYSMRQDEAEDVRKNATQIWKDYIDNTPRWVKRGLRHLVTVLCKIIVPLPTLGLNTI